MKKLLLISLLALAACKKESNATDTVNDSISTDTTLIAPPEEESALNDTTETVAPERTTANPEESVTGNFTGKTLTAIATLIREGQGNPVEDGIADEYSIIFNDPNIAAIPAGCCEMILVNEGDLDGDGYDELGIAQAPMNGCTYNYMAYTYKNGKWKPYVDMFLIPTACEGISRDDVQQLVFKEGNTVYFMQADLNDENFKKVKTKAKLLK